MTTNSEWLRVRAESEADDIRLVTAVVPARNEAPTVGAVLRELLAAERVGEVILVANGCNDDTEAIALSLGVTVIQSDPCLGKGGAVRTGLEHASHDTVLLVDADVIGFHRDHVRQLVEPMRHDHVSMTLGLFDRGRIRNWIYLHLLPRFTGQRCVRRKQALSVPSRAFKLYRIEAGLNAFLARRGVILGSVLKDTRQRTRRHKEPSWFTGYRHEAATVVGSSGWLAVFLVAAKKSKRSGSRTSLQSRQREWSSRASVVDSGDAA